MDSFFLDLSILLVFSAIFSTLAIYCKQPIIIAYIACGMLLGPNALGWIRDVSFMENISHLGITLLLFLAGLCLHPQKLVNIFSKTLAVTAGNCILSFGFGFLIPFFFHFSMLDCLVIGLASMFSSTILVVKLLPTTALHHQHMGAICIAILIMQDLLAVAVLAFIRCMGSPDGAILSFTLLTLKLIGLILILVAAEYFIIRRVMAKVDRFHEALFIIGLAWCFGVATFSHRIGLFYETGAFFSGIVLARHSIARFISEELKPLRDFFLVLFFFTLGARIDLSQFKELLGISLIMIAFFVFVRPKIFSALFRLTGEKPTLSNELGVRLGQLSEFGLLIGILALEENVISLKAGNLIQWVTIGTFVISSYRVFSYYSTPIGVNPKD